ACLRLPGTSLPGARSTSASTWLPSSRTGLSEIRQWPQRRRASAAGQRSSTVCSRFWMNTTTDRQELPMDNSVDLLPLFIKEFDLCQVKQGEIVPIIAPPESRSESGAGAAAAAAALGAVPFQILVPHMRTAIGAEPLLNHVRGNGGSVPAL